MIETDLGPAYLKAINNPEGVHILACDWLGTLLASRIGLPTFDVSVLNLTDLDEIPLGDVIAQTGPSYVTRAERGSVMGTSIALNGVTNPEILAKLVVLDTWLRNCDRYGPGYGKGGLPRQNLDNLFLSEEGAKAGRFLLKPIDFGHIITCGRALTRHIANIEVVRDPRIYGFFPFFTSHVGREQIIEASRFLDSVDSSMWEDIVASIPSEWEIDETIKTAIDKFLKGRAMFLAENLPSLLPVDTEQTLLGFEK